MLVAVWTSILSRGGRKRSQYQYFRGRVSLAVSYELFGFGVFLGRIGLCLFLFLGSFVLS